MVAFDTQKIVFWDYYQFVGTPGNAKNLPYSPLRYTVFDQTSQLIHFTDIENNFWQLSDKNVFYKTTFKFRPRGLSLMKNIDNDT